MSKYWNDLNLEVDKLSSYNYGYFDTQLLERTFTWGQEKTATAVLESHRERVRQVLAEMSKVDSSVWAQGLAYVQRAKSIEDLKKVCNSFDISWKDSGNMTTKNAEIALLKTEVDKLNAKIKKLQFGRFGEEPGNGTVFKIERRFEQFGKGYTYAAVRAGGEWYLTGTRGEATKTMTWEGLKIWAGKYSRVWKMTVAEELVD